MEMKECSNMKVVILDYEDGSIRILNSDLINFDCLENEHNNDLESYLFDQHDYNNSMSHYMVTDDLKIFFD